jgi:hypothetical protein
MRAGRAAGRAWARGLLAAIAGTVLAGATGDAGAAAISGPATVSSGAPAPAAPPSSSSASAATASPTATTSAAGGKAPVAAALDPTRPTVSQPVAQTRPPFDPQRTVIREPAPRPLAAVRVQQRFAEKAQHAQILAGADYLARGDFFVSPGARVAAAYYPIEALGVELQVSHYWSSLDAEAQRIRNTLGAIPDSHAPEWLVLVGARYSIGYGKLMVGGLGGAIHFEPQAFLHAGMHDHSGDLGPSVDAGLGFLVFLTPKLFVRADGALVFERESRSSEGVSVWGVLPSLSIGGLL